MIIFLSEDTENLNTNFHQWFEGSKVIDTNGNSLICYHGTNKNNFTKFDINKVGSATDTGMYGTGFYFTNNEKLASTYKRDTNGTIMKVFLAIKNPLFIKTKDDIPKIDVPNQTIEDMKKSAENYSKLFREYLINNEYDGVIETITAQHQYVALYPNQIKSIFNNGNWSKNSSNIYE